MTSFVDKCWKTAVDPKNWVLLAVFLVADLLLSAVVVAKINYTEIDWRAYMEEVEGFLGGERDYVNLKGSTGPLVYPAGFVYIFAGLRALTSQGTDILAAQCIFVGVYLLNLLIVFAIYFKGGKVPALLCAALVLSKRIHSIYMLRMFNDCIAVLLGHMAIYLFCKHRWRLGSLLYSLAVSVKMNMLLYAPGLLLVLLLGTNTYEAFTCIALCGAVQLLLGLPFLTAHPVSYITKAFEFGRVFTYTWTVNYKFLSEALFTSPALSAALLLATVAAYALFARKWTQEAQRGHAKMPSLLPASREVVTNRLSANFIAGTLWTSNLIGVVLARSLHYQFYCWYFHSLPFLLFQTPLPVWASVALMLGAEVSFNVFPSTAWSSLLLQVCHIGMLAAAYCSSVPGQPLAEEAAEEEEADKGKAKRT